MVRLAFALLVLVTLAAEPALAQIVAYEATSFPEVDDPEWVPSPWCTPVRSITEDGWLRQELDVDGCDPLPIGDRDLYRRPIDEFNDMDQFFLEFRVFTNGDQSEIPWAAPADLVLANSYGSDYTTVVAKDRVKLYRSVGIPVLFFNVQEGVPHTVRIELDNTPPPTYRWYIDGAIVDEGLAVDAFPSHNARTTWLGGTAYLSNETEWDYVRYGVPPVPGSGDYNADDLVDAYDFYFFKDCFDRDTGADPDPGAWPGCAFVDFNNDQAINCDDWFGGDDFDGFRDVWTGPPADPPDFDLCVAPPAPRIPFSPHRAAKSFIATPPPPGDDVGPGEGDSAIGD